MKKKIIYISSAVVFLTAGILFFRSYSMTNQTFEFETTHIKKGTISSTITATGKIEAIKTVNVGTQVSGVIDKIFVDFNTLVKKGQLLAKIDETPLLAQLEQSKATVDQTEAELVYQKATFARYKVLAEKKLIAQSDFDLVVSNMNKAVANRNSAKSVYDKNKINLAYASIFSPIDGIVLFRAVDEGQTVAASFNTPTLFTIANDLTQMRVEANVDEADIGQVKMNERVEFTVDAYPDQKFSGAVTEIRLQPVETSNVVTYTVIIQAPNPDKKLMPGMTASTTIFVNEKKDILVVPGKAIRFTPDEETYSAYLKSIPGESIKSIEPQQQKGTKESTYIWTKNGLIIEKKLVKTGANDGINYELVSGLNEGDEIILSMAIQKSVEAKKSVARSPFMPQRPGQRK